MNSNVYEKSKGVLLFAFNSARVNYVNIADQTSQLIEKHLKLPITLVTDHDAEPKFNYDRIIRASSKSGNTRNDRENNQYEWKNLDRYMAYELSPYDTTLLCDVDYAVFDTSLLKLFDQDYDYKLMYHTQTPKEFNNDEMGPVSLPMVWATVVIFKKTNRAKIFFDLIGRIQRNYNYYRLLFKIRDGNYRNDFAFSMANIISNGYTIPEENNIPWTMTTIDKNIDTAELKNNFIVIKYKDTTTADVLSKQNLHIMDKNFLVSEQFKSIVDKVCNE
jgi:hypothetical protein